MINSNGLIIEESVSIYNDATLREAVGELAFSSEVWVLEELMDGKVYSISTDEIEKKYYLQAKEVKINPSFNSITKFETLAQLVEFLPTEFTSSYEYYIAHLHFDLDELKNKFQGAMHEEEDALGNKVIIMPQNNVSFKANSEGTVETIVVHNIEGDQLKSYLESPTNEGFVTFQIDNFYFVVNFSERLMSISSVE